jgi:hypothetical protein
MRNMILVDLQDHQDDARNTEETRLSDLIEILRHHAGMSASETSAYPG